MKFSKRMMIVFVATVMLLASSLSYFTYANDVEPCGPVQRCPQCNETVSKEIAAKAGPYSGAHDYNGQICHYQFMIVTFEFVCANGHRNHAGSYQVETAHTLCGK